MKSHDMRLLLNVASGYVATVWSAGILIVFIPIIFSIFGSDFFGLFGYYQVILSITSVVVSGFPSAILKSLSSKGVDGKNFYISFEILFFIISMMIFLIIYSLSGAMAKYWFNIDSFDVKESSNIIVAMGVSSALQVFSLVSQSGLKALDYHYIYNVIFSISQTARYALVILLARYAGMTEIDVFWIFPIVDGVTVFFQSISIWIILPKSRTPLRPSWIFIRDASVFGMQVNFGKLLRVLSMQADRIILSYVLTTSTFGYYQIAYSLSNSILKLVGPIYSVSYPRLSYYISNSEWKLARKFFLNSFEFIIIFFIIPCLTISIFSNLTLSVWLGDSSFPPNSKYILSILTMAVMLDGIYIFSSVLQLAAGASGVYARINAIIAAMTVALVVPAAFEWGAIGAAVGLLLRSVLLNVLAARLDTHRLRRKLLWGTFVRLLMILSLAGVAMCGLSTVVVTADLGRWLGFSVLVGLCVCGALLSVGSSRLLRQRIRSILR